MNPLYIALGFAVLALAYVGYDKWKTQKQAKELGKMVRIHLFEQTGRDKVYIGEYRGEEKSDEELGIYIKITKLNKAISQIQPNDFFPDKNFGKCILACKYASDDIRPMSRMNNEEWFKRVELPPEEYLEMETVEDDDGTKHTQPKQDKEGNYIPLVDEEGKPFPQYRLVNYEEPLGINQGAREAQRFERSFTKRMEEARKQKNGFWDKYGTYVMMGGILMFCFISMAYSINKTNEAHLEMTQIFKEEADNLLNKVDDPSPMFVESLMAKLDKKQTQEAAPQK